MPGSLELLADTVTAADAVALAASLEIDGSRVQALAVLGSEHPARDAFRASFELIGASALASVLRGFAVSRESSRTDVRPVWSGPTFQGDGDHTTAALAHLVDEATTDVFASTYSAADHSPFVDALWRAIGRGVDVTMLVDTMERAKTASALQKRLFGARFLTYRPAGGAYGLQHSKVLIVDSRVALVTSANLSRAAAHRNLEAGVLIRDAAFASGLRQRFRQLAQTPTIVALPSPAIPSTASMDTGDA
ncbi:hypothetical protein GCM10017608_25600 [Agromyces luteolus]|uniref:phospholipase D n=1 Tax=Agromyces luteolus TaxID=88373 RepID=A0A7C9LYR0_9MICO|nr:DISARM system phospholipase D-like protein DrmC [Agromyces luteolus]MUN08939.1 hypothetical protein [Agromyces luteolus]GLK28625.1 hypothetical protein GCM10017608_25600 [Agromyces luteolus]